MSDCKHVIHNNISDIKNMANNGNGGGAIVSVLQAANDDTEIVTALKGDLKSASRNMVEFR